MIELSIASAWCLVGGMFGVVLGLAWGFISGKKVGREEERESISTTVEFALPEYRLAKPKE